MKILIIGSGGREHSLAERLYREKDVELFSLPGNPGIWQIAPKVNIDTNDFSATANFCKEKGIAYVVVGPEQPLADGLADYLISKGIPVFGPTKLAAEIESSKVFAKNLMQKYGIPTAKYGTFTKQTENEALDFILKTGLPIVIKADGLAAGKGVLICETFESAKEELSEIFGGMFGSAGNSVVIEEFLVGEEASIFALTDGIDYVLLPAAQDHKRAFDGDLGKNTGGMGAYAPAPIINSNLLDEIEEEIILPSINAMRAEGRKFVGCLYFGLIITKDGPKVIEYNCRFGDPETEAVLQLVEGNFAELLYSISNGSIDKSQVKISSEKYASCVVLASGGYPDLYPKGLEISGLESDFWSNTKVFHAGTSLKDDKIVTNGGRVLCVTSVADTLQDSLDLNYNAISKIDFEGMFYRKDIGQKAFKHLK
jgi:phosphoribosylamine--glycine ligase